jgi:hypothetical protein
MEVSIHDITLDGAKENYRYTEVTVGKGWRLTEVSLYNRNVRIGIKSSRELKHNRYLR